MIKIEEKGWIVETASAMENLSVYTFNFAIHNSFSELADND